MQHVRDITVKPLIGKVLRVLVVLLTGIFACFCFPAEMEQLPGNPESHTPRLCVYNRRACSNGAEKIWNLAQPAGALLQAAMKYAKIQKCILLSFTGIEELSLEKLHELTDSETGEATGSEALNLRKVLSEGEYRGRLFDMYKEVMEEINPLYVFHHQLAVMSNRFFIYFWEGDLFQDHQYIRILDIANGIRQSVDRLNAQAVGFPSGFFDTFLVKVIVSEVNVGRSFQ